MRNKVYPCLWYDTQAKEAATFYCSIFPDSYIELDMPAVVHFELGGIKLMGLNGGPPFKFNPSISLFITCHTDEEVLYYWEKLSADGTVLMPLGKYDWSDHYGWCADRYGLTWQIYKAHKGDNNQLITPLLLFSNKQYGKAERAVNFYTSLFENSEILGMAFYGKNAPQAEGMVLHSHFMIEGRMLMAMDGPGDHNFDFNEAVSFVLECDTQDEIDQYWEALTVDGEEGICGWCKDQFGVSWQIVPTILKEIMSERARGQRVMEAILKMKKLNIETIMKA